MDGLPQDFASDLTTAPQRTLKAAIDCVGVGVHCGEKVRLTLSPAPAGTGIVFHRTDLGAAVAARYDNVVDTRMCTVLGSATRPELRIGTVEHLMAALAGAGVSNVVVGVDGPEVPILDGSAANFSFLVECAGLVDQDEPTAAIEVMRPVRVALGGGTAELLPNGGHGLELELSIAFDAAAIGEQALSLRLSPGSFRELARARTFALASEVASLKAHGLARGGSLDNAVVVDGASVLNPGGLRMRDEFVRHKMLDAVGDLALAGAALQGRFVGHRSGHALNNHLLRALFADDANWRPAPARGRYATSPAWSVHELQAA